jgi:glycosyltransferase involved in cell wall biosynthesis
MLFSIIIPHFNSIESLKNLVKTIPNRDDLEIIIIDDNSDSMHDVHEVNHYSLIKRFKNNSNNKGAGACRNIGLTHATGQWLIFADADDYFLDCAFNKIETTLGSDLDIIYFSPMSKCLITEQDSDRHLFYQELVQNYLTNNDPVIRYRFSVPWSKVYSSEFIAKYGILFDEVLASNDVMFSLKSGHLAQNICVTQESIYCVTRGKGTLTVNRSNSILQSRFNVEMERLDYIQEHGITSFKDSLSGILIKYRSIISLSLLSTVVKALLDRKITLFPTTYKKYLKHPKSIIDRLKKRKTSDKNNKYQ